MIKVKPSNECKYDILSLGEVMLRLDPGEGRIRTASSFTAWEGGGEYNVARGLRRCFGMRAALASALVENEVGYLLENFILQGGVDTSHIKWMPFDGVGRAARNSINFTERGFGVRGAVGCSDRGHSACANLKAGDIDWETIFCKEGVRWMHTGGIFAALSETAPEVVIEAMKTARKYGTVISYDLNYRPSLWNSVGGHAKAQLVNKEIANFVDVMIGNEEDFTACLGFEVEGVDKNISNVQTESFKKMIAKVVETYPNFKAIGTTLREVKSATLNDWSAICWADGNFYESKKRPNLEILDRVGGGDSFASGLIYGLMELQDAQSAVEYGAAHGALAMTTPGDTSMARLSEVKKLAGGGSARVDR